MWLHAGLYAQRKRHNASWCVILAGPWGLSAQFFVAPSPYLLISCTVKLLAVKDVEDFCPVTVLIMLTHWSSVLQLSSSLFECDQICKDRPEYSARSRSHVPRFMCTELGGVFGKYTFVKLHISPNWFMQSWIRMSVLSCLFCGVMCVWVWAKLKFTTARCLFPPVFI